MALTVLTAASTRMLTTAEAVMAETPGIVDVVHLETMIRQASAAIERLCGTVFAQQRYREVFTPSGRGASLWTMGREPVLFLTRRPLMLVDQVSEGGLLVTDYRIMNAMAGMLYRAGGWGWGYVSALPAEDLTVDYVTGYILPEQVSPPLPDGEFLPDDLERAAIEWTKSWWHERFVADRVTSRGFGEQRISYQVWSSGAMTAIPSVCRDLLRPWLPVVLR